MGGFDNLLVLADMKTNFLRRAFELAVAFGMAAGVLAEDDVADLEFLEDYGPEPLSHLMEAVDSLKAKRIPQAYFLLSSAQVPASPVFLPDTRGGGFILVNRGVNLPDGIDPETALAEFKKLRPKSRAPVLDEKNNRLLWYSDEAWRHLVAVLKPWTVGQKEVRTILEANPFIPRENDLVIRIPDEKMAGFYRALMKAWKTDKDRFRCFADWN